MNKNISKIIIILLIVAIIIMGILVLVKNSRIVENNSLKNTSENSTVDSLETDIQVMSPGEKNDKIPDGSVPLQKQ